MGTSGRTTSGARLAGPRGRPDRLSRQSRTSKSPLGFKWEKGPAEAGPTCNRYRLGVLFCAG